jgi:hypothetical protein
MAANIISALDTFTMKQTGEKGHSEYRWSNDVREKILQFTFQLTRTEDIGVLKLKNLLEHLLFYLKNIVEQCSSSSVVAKANISILYRIIAHTRDIVDGKGEYKLAYMMIYTWYSFYPEFAKYALKCMVDLGDNVHPYGSWKDIKYFCEYCKNQSEKMEHPLIQYAIQLINDQLKIDYANLISNGDNISLAAKWTPREKSSFGWLYQSLATNYFSHYLGTAYTEDKNYKAILKCKTEYRKMLSLLNHKIDTLQIKQCSHIWSKIDFNRVTSISLAKQKKAFLNIKANGEVRCPLDEDRTECARKFDAHIKKAIMGGTEMKGKRVGMTDFTNQALRLIKCPNQIEIDLLNSQWRDNSTQTEALGNMIAMVDVSGSMGGDPLYAAIAIGLRIAEKSALGKRIMTFSAKPSWVNLDAAPDFVSQVKLVKNADWGMNTNFYAANDMILDAIIQNKMSPEDVQDMMLVILSDMQMDVGDRCDKQALYETMKTKYEAAGVRVHGKPYKPPHILFWNLRSTNGFPSLSNQANCSMISGFSPALLNLFCEQGIEAIQSSSPWSLLERSLENERYKIMGDKILQEI